MKPSCPGRFRLCFSRSDSPVCSGRCRGWWTRPSLESGRPGGAGTGFHLRPLSARCQRSCCAPRPCRGWACRSCLTPHPHPALALPAAWPPERWKLTCALGHGPHVRPRPSLRRPCNALCGNTVTSSVKQMFGPSRPRCLLEVLPPAVPRPLSRRHGTRMEPAPVPCGCPGTSQVPTGKVLMGFVSGAAGPRTFPSSPGILVSPPLGGPLG